MVKPTNTAAIEAETGLAWPDWCAALKDAGGDELTHNQIVHAARAIRPISGWWAQGVAVAYEQHINRRLPGQTSDGLFSVSVSRSIAGQPDDVFAQWCEFGETITDVAGKSLCAAPTSSQTPKWRYWRCKFDDGSRLTLTLQASSPTKVRLAIEHAKLPDHSDIAVVKAAWVELLSACFGDA